MLTLLLKVWNTINGYKTYITGTVAIVALWAQVWSHTLDVSSAINGTLAALTAMGIRHGVSKSQ